MIVDQQLKRTVEALLFSSSRKLELEELSKLCRSPPEHVENVLRLIRQELEENQSAMMLVQEGTAWRLVVRERYLPIVRKIVRKTELPKGHLETLAVVAYKAPVLQSKIAKLRTNKAYDHLRLLEQNGFITREKHGRTRLLKLTQKFFDYFDLSQEQLQAKFRKVQELEQVIEAKEKEASKAVVEAKPQGFETFPTVEPAEAKDEIAQPVEILKEQLGELEVYEEEKPVKEKSKKARKRKAREKVEVKEKEIVAEEKPEAEKEEAEEAKSEEEKRKKVKKPEVPPSKGLFPKGPPPEIEAKIEARVKEIVGEAQKEEVEKESEA